MVAALLDATVRVLLHDGYEGLSTNRVAEMAGVSVGSLYQYFPNKVALVHGVMERWAELAMARVLALRDTMATADLRLGVQAVVRELIALNRENPKLHKVLLEQVPRVGAYDAHEQLNRRFEELLAAWLELHADALEVEDPTLAAHFVLRSMVALVDHALMHRPEFLDSARFARHLERLVLGYLAPSLLLTPRRRGR
jgi:AcrR family transcriptional regulator